MCLAIPMEVRSINWPMAQVLSQGLKCQVNIQLVPKVSIGDYVLVHAGFAIQILDKNVAKESIELWDSLEF